MQLNNNRSGNIHILGKNCRCVSQAGFFRRTLISRAGLDLAQPYARPPAQDSEAYLFSNSEEHRACIRLWSG